MMAKRLILASAVLLPLAAAVPSARALAPAAGQRAALEVVVESVASPRNLSFDKNGDLYIPSAGAGGTEACARVDEGYMCAGLTGAILRVPADELAVGRTVPATADVVVDRLPSMAVPGGALAHGVHGVAARNGTVYAVFISKEFLGTEHSGECCRPEVQGPLLDAALQDLGNLMKRTPSGGFARVADVSNFEYTNNPVNDIHSNPYAVAIDRDESFIVADAAANTLLRVRPNGAVRLIAAFDNLNTAPVAPGSTEAVPTGVAVGPDGSYYVSLLGAFHPTMARILQVSPTGTVRTIADGLTTVTSVAVARDGTVYATELGPGDLVRVQPDPNRPNHFLPPEFLYRGQLTTPAGVAVGPDGWIYISDRAVAAPTPFSAGRIVRVVG
jgi:streptogramin lyase